jgi:hypothetical protein
VLLLWIALLTHHLLLRPRPPVLPTPLQTHADCYRFNPNQEEARVECQRPLVRFKNKNDSNSTFKVCRCLTLTLPTDNCEEASCTFGAADSCTKFNYNGRLHQVLAILEFVVAGAAALFAGFVGIRVCAKGACSKNATSTTLMWCVLATVAHLAWRGMNVMYPWSNSRVYIDSWAIPYGSTPFSIFQIAMILNMPLMWYVKGRRGRRRGVREREGERVISCRCLVALTFPSPPPPLPSPPLHVFLYVPRSNPTYTCTPAYILHLLCALPHLYVNLSLALPTPTIYPTPQSG